MIVPPIPIDSVLSSLHLVLDLKTCEFFELGLRNLDGKDLDVKILKTKELRLAQNLSGVFPCQGSDQLAEVKVRHHNDLYFR